MHQGKTFLGIIPARGGSKRLPGKNLQDLGGKPLLAWSIEAALDCGLLDHVLVSTDDPAIADVARQFGADVPFLRPQALAGDMASSVDVVVHVLEGFKHDLGREFEFIVLLQPTSPLRRAEDIVAALELLASRGGDAVVSVCEAEHSPLWMNTLPDDLNMAGFLSNEVRDRRSQDLPQYYRLNGAIYVCRTDRLLIERTFFISSAIYAHVMNRTLSIDIDVEADLDMARCLLQARKVGRRT